MLSITESTLQTCFTSIFSHRASHANSMLRDARGIYASPASPPTVPPRGKSKVVIMPAVCAVAGGSDALLALEPLL